jgi:ribonuclease G
MKQLFIDQPFAERGMTRTALVTDGRLREIFIDYHEKGSCVGRIFLGIVRNILPSQFAFIDIGANKNAFMNVTPAHKIQAGQPVTVQVQKDASGTKGAYVGQEININGRFVIINASDYPQIGVSQKISGKKERRRLQKIVKHALPAGYGAIIRTNADGKDADTITAEVARLLARHQAVTERAKHSKAPVLLYQDNLLLHDLLSDDVHEIIVSDTENHEKVLQTLALAAPSMPITVRLSEDSDLFNSQGITRQIKRALQKNVNLPCGGFITIEQTEACVIIDVNTGHYAGKGSYRETIMTVNLEAAVCLAWQLALRNLSGMIIVDFIDMTEKEDKQALIDALQECLKKDRIRTEIAGMTELGLVQLTRKKTRESLSRILERECECCKGTGRVQGPSC